MDADVDIKFIATCNNLEYKNNNRNPVKGMVRFEFMECLIRIADEKYMKKSAPVVEDHYEACDKLINDHCLNVYINYDS